MGNQNDPRNEEKRIPETIGFRPRPEEYVVGVANQERIGFPADANAAAKALWFEFFVPEHSPGRTARSRPLPIVDRLIAHADHPESGVFGAHLRVKLGRDNAGALDPAELTALEFRVKQLEEELAEAKQALAREQQQRVEELMRVEGEVMSRMEDEGVATRQEVQRLFQNDLPSLLEKYIAKALEERQER